MPQFMRTTGHKTLKAEVESIIKFMKSGKANGTDGIPIEALMALSKD